MHYTNGGGYGCLESKEAYELTYRSHAVVVKRVGCQADRLALGGYDR